VAAKQVFPDDAVTGSKASMSAQDCRASSWRAVACSASGDGGRKPVQGRIANAKSFGWAIYAAGFAIWLFGYLSVAPLFSRL
jgi:hypothetical protein